jgi:mycoredoxin
MSTPIQRDAQASTEATGQVVMYSTGWCGDCRRARRVFDALGVPYTEIDIDREPAAAETVMRLNHGMRSVPTIIFPDGSKLVEPSNAALEAKIAELTGQPR